MFSLLLLGAPILAGAASAQDILFQDDVQGGISVDGSGVSTAYDGSSTWEPGDDLVVEIPSTATVTDVILILHGKWAGWSTSPVADVAVNGVDLSSATLLSSDTRYLAYDLDPTTYGITAAGSYTWEETGAADSGYNVSFRQACLTARTA